jgi:DNA-directed RNA polymerase III subunit RPC7
MPRGGGRPGGGGRNQGPESWDDDDQAPVLLANRPAPTFPEIVFPTPRPFSTDELESINKYLSFRSRARNGPFCAALDPSSLTDDKGKIAPRAGFDPFNDQEVFSSNFQKKKRTIPEVVGTVNSLKMFPKELWSIIDPKKTDPWWSTLDPAELAQAKSRKRKRRPSTAVDGTGENAGDDSDADSDAIVSGRRKHKTEQTRRGEKDAKQRRGLDAEDDYPDGDANAEDDAEGEEEPQDSEFDESEDEDNDYNAENYFDAGDDDDMGGGDDDDGGGGEWYS